MYTLIIIIGAFTSTVPGFQTSGMCQEAANSLKLQKPDAALVCVRLDDYRK